VAICGWGLSQFQQRPGAPSEPATRRHPEKRKILFELGLSENSSKSPLVGADGLP